MEENKFSFDISFQEEVLRFILNNSDGYKALDFLNHQYFSLLEHSVIAFSIDALWKNTSTIPSRPLLRNRLQTSFRDRLFADALTSSDRNEILSLVDDLYSRPAKDGKEILLEIVRFASYVDLKNTLENFQLEDYHSYKSFSERVIQAIHKEDQLQEKRGTFLIKEIKERQLSRQAQDLIVPSPFYQLNRLTSAGGFSPASVLVILDKPKRLKTTLMVNITRRYLARKKKVLYIDLENGELEIVTREEQSIGRVTKKEIIAGTKDKEIQKVLRRYRRIGGEMYVRRLPGFSTALDIQRVINEIYREEGLLFDVLIIDYLALMGSISGKTDDFGRISDAYVDVANLAFENNFEVVWTANHVVRGSSKRERTRYIGDDIAKCIDIVRHAQGIFGLNRSIEEEENGIVRFEIVEGRETLPRGRGYFRVDAATQRVDELTKKEIAQLSAEGVLYNPDNAYGEEKEDHPKKEKTTGDI